MASVWRLPQVAAQARQEGSLGLALAAEHLLTAAQAQVPVDEGTLRASGAVSVDVDTATVSFDTPYAVRQHEEIGYHHPKGGKPKYLEDPFHDEADMLKKIIATQVRRAHGGIS